MINKGNGRIRTARSSRSIRKLQVDIEELNERLNNVAFDRREEMNELQEIKTLIVKFLEKKSQHK